MKLDIKKLKEHVGTTMWHSIQDTVSTKNIILQLIEKIESLEARNEYLLNNIAEVHTYLENAHDAIDELEAMVSYLQRGHQ